MTSIADRLAHLAIWIALYMPALYVCLRQAAGLPMNWNSSTAIALICAASTAIGVYLLDRVKLRNDWLDPGDRAAHPGRIAYLTHQTARVRCAAVAAGLVGAATGAMLSPLAPVVVIGAFLGVIAYAGLPRTRQRRRIKDRLVVKNAAVSGSMSAFALFLLAAVERGEQSELAWVLDNASVLWPGVAFVALLVLGDAILCDVDDRQADRAFGTRTIPALAGVSLAWSVAGVLFATAAVIVISAGGTGRLAWGIGLLISLVPLARMRWATLRDRVDLRLPALAVGVSILEGLGVLT